MANKSIKLNSSDKNSSDDDEETDKPNPFSFKQFLDKEPKSTASSIDLPDLSSISIDKSSKSSKKSTNKDKNPFSFKQFVEAESEPSILLSLPHVNTRVNDDDDDSDVDDDDDKVGTNDIELPDPIDTSQTGLLEYILPDCDVESKSNYDNELNIPAADPKVSTRTLQAENAKLKQQVEMQKKQYDEQRQLIKKLEKRISELREREETENKTLELMIQNVEANLVETRERAAKSESLVESLKNETLKLKAQVLSLTTENGVLRQSKQYQSDAQRQLLDDYASKLSFAAGNAEKSLKELLGGVETLRLMSTALGSFGKITEMNSDTNVR